MSLFFYKNEGTFRRADALLFHISRIFINNPQNKPVIKWSDYGSIMGSFISLYFYKKNGLFI